MENSCAETDHAALNVYPDFKTPSEDIIVPTVDVQDAKAKVCPICCGTRFIPGPHGRMASTGALPQCGNCQSLERHRIARNFFNQLRPYFGEDYSCLHISNDRSVESNWFKTYELSVYEKINSINLEDIERPADHYNIVICNHVLEHLSDDMKGVRELVRILKYDGYLVLTVPAPNHSPKTQEWGYPDYRKHGHYRVYGPDACKRFASMAPWANWTQTLIDDDVTGDRDLILVATRSARSLEQLQRIFPQLKVVHNSDDGIERVHKAQIHTFLARVEGKNGSISGYAKTHLERYSFLLTDLRAITTTGDRILDVAGTRQTEVMAKHFLPGRQIDLLSKIDIENEGWNVEDETYDVVTLTEVIEHLGDDPSHAVWNCARVAKRGGKLLITTVNLARLVSTYDLVCGRTPYVMGNVFGKGADRHDREYVPVELALMVAAQGFRVALSTFDCYERSPRQAAMLLEMQKSLPLNNLLKRDTIRIIASREFEVPDRPRKLWPVVHHTLSENRAETTPVDLLNRVGISVGHQLIPLNHFQLSEIDRGQFKW